jgi:protocatechuate 3,4-dioxygenase beta subunit
MPPAPHLLLIVAALSCGDSDAPMARFSGSVRDAETAAPIADASVGFWSNIPFESSVRLGHARTDADGRYTATVKSPPGYAGPNCAVMKVIVSAPGYGTQEIPVEWLTDEMLCTRRRAATIEFTLYAETGEP